MLQTETQLCINYSQRHPDQICR